MTTTWARVAVDTGERVVSLVPELLDKLTEKFGKSDKEKKAPQPVEP